MNIPEWPLVYISSHCNYSYVSQLMDAVILHVSAKHWISHHSRRNGLTRKIRPDVPVSTSLSHQSQTDTSTGCSLGNKEEHSHSIYHTTFISL
uniref:Uncharacterized protein n=1 Tax=Arundo donax TaxID=35708 RepID=A0A0A9GMH0_ARUDO